jgi:signal transduction histidine kinase
MGEKKQISGRSSCSVGDFFQLACEDHGAAMLLINPATGAIIRANREACGLLEGTGSELEGKGITDIFLPDGGAHSSPDLENNWTGLRRGTNGEERLIEILPRRLPLQEGNVLFCVLRDMTELTGIRHEREEQENVRRQLEIVVKERTRQLNETMEALRLETARRQQIETNVTTMRESLENQERARVARDIHDGIGQTLQAIKLQLKMRQARCQSGELCDGQTLNGVIAEIGSASAELREISMALRPLFLEDTDLDMAVRSLCARSAKRTGLDVRAECQGTFRGLGSSFKLSIFRICQEALANIVKHSGCSSALIRLEREPHTMRITIRDDGIGGVSCPTIISQEGSGLAIMRERAELLGGALSVISPPGMGTAITVEVPLQ